MHKNDQIWYGLLPNILQRQILQIQRGEAECDKGLAIGGYKSALLANLVASYLLEETEEYFEKTKFHGIYRDDGIVAFNGKLTFAEIQVWLKRFQEKINKITGGTFLNLRSKSGNLVRMTKSKETNVLRTWNQTSPSLTWKCRGQPKAPSTSKCMQNPIKRSYT